MDAPTTKDEFLEALMAPLLHEQLFTREEALSLIRAIVADEQDQLRTNAESVFKWAITTRSRSAVLDVILELGTTRSIAVVPDDDGGIKMWLTPERGSEQS